VSIPATSRLFCFGLFEADLENARLTRKGVRIRLQEQPFRILAMLLEHSGQVVTREELRQQLWPAGTYVDFDGSLNAALKRLRGVLDDDANNPRFIETVPKRGYRFIAPVTIQDSQTPAETEPRNEPAPAASNASRPVPAWTSSGTLFRASNLFRGAAGVGLAILAIAFFVSYKRTAAPPRSAATGSVDLGSLRRSIAVLGFQNASGRSSDSWLSTALAEMLRTELSAGRELRVVPGEDVAQFRAGAPWSETDSLSRQTASRIGKALDSDLLVLGSFAVLGDTQNGSIRVDFRLQDAQTGETLYEGAETGNAKQFFGLAATVGTDLRERLGMPMISESEEAGVVSSLPSDPDANRFYSLGLAKLRNADVAAARDLFLQAEKLAPRFPLVHLMLYRAWAGLGYDQNAKDEIRTAYQFSAGLTEADKLQIEGSYYLSIQKLDKAISAYRALYSLYPDSVDYAEQLIIALNNPIHYEEALGVIKQLRKLPPPASQDPRIDFWEGQLLSYSGGTASQPYFEKAAAEAASRGQKLLYAHFRLQQCVNLVYGDHPQGSTVYCREAYNIFMAAGNHLYAADALRTMGDRRGAKGDMGGARELYQRALALLMPLGEHEKTGVVLNNMAIGYEIQGQFSQAQKLFHQAAETWTQCDDLLHAGVAMGNLGDIFMAHGQLHKAELQYKRAQEQIEALDPNGTAYLLYSIANIRLLEGDIAGAQRYTAQALVVARRMKDTGSIAGANETMGAIQIAADELAGARGSFQQALTILQQRGSKIGVAETKAALAGVSIEEGNFPKAEQLLRKSVAEFQAEGSVMDEVQSETDLARALLHQGKLAEARHIISEALDLSDGSGDPALQLPLVILSARVQVAELVVRSSAERKGAFSVPRRKLLDALARAHRLGYYQIECDARLALAELDLHAKPAIARALLAQLSREARAHGLNLIARKAAAL